MAETHDFKTEVVEARDLQNFDVLVGECGGLSAVFGVSVKVDGTCWVDTEHGTLLTYPEAEFDTFVE